MKSPLMLRKYAFTFGFGIIAGAILGLLYAPVPGQKMQKRIGDVRDQVDELQQKVRKIANA
jgi:gas vesicle protein